MFSFSQHIPVVSQENCKEPSGEGLDELLCCIPFMIFQSLLPENLAFSLFMVSKSRNWLRHKSWANTHYWSMALRPLVMPSLISFDDTNRALCLFAAHPFCSLGHHILLSISLSSEDQAPSFTATHPLLLIRIIALGYM